MQIIGFPLRFHILKRRLAADGTRSMLQVDPKGWIRYNFPILWYLLLLSREIDTRRGEGDQESEPGPSLQTVPS